MSTLTAAKESFYTHTLIPLGQMTEILLAVLRVHTAIRHPGLGKYRGDLGQAIFELLTLSHCFAWTPIATIESLEKVAKSLNENFLPVLLKSLQTANGMATPSRTIQRDTREIRQLVAAAAEIVYMDIGFKPSELNVLLAIPGVASAFRGPGRRINQWRTLVRHREWALTLRCLPERLKPPAMEVRNRLERAQSAGSESAQKLWDQMFNSERYVVTVVTPAVVAPSVVPATGVNETTPLTPNPKAPVGLTAQAMPRGTLLVTLEFDPRSMLSGPKQLAMNREPLASAMNDTLQVSKFTRECSVALLPRAVEEANVWLVAQRARKSAIEQEFEAQKLSIFKKAVRQKAERLFTVEERKVLREFFIAETPASAA